MADLRPPHPSATDGYRRLARTTSGSAAPEHDTGQQLDAPRSRRRRTVVGALRLTALIAALAVVIGTSVSLAVAGGSRSAESSSAKSTTVTTTTTSTTDTTDTTSESETPPAVETEPAVEPEAAAQSAPVVSDEPEVAAATATPSNRPAVAATRQTPLPFTGEGQFRWVLLGGAMLLIVGMAVQISVEPLPASRSHANQQAR